MADTERKLSIDEMERLIEAVRCKPGIYNQRLPVYKDQFLKKPKAGFPLTRFGRSL